MLAILYFRVLGVHRRIGGLEVFVFTRPLCPPVHRCVSGLEEDYSGICYLLCVYRRIGG